MTLMLEKLALGGDCIGRKPAAGKDGKGAVVFVPFGVPGDSVELERESHHKTFARAWIKKVETPSPNRIEAPCPYHYQPGREPLFVCGGCDWQQLSYEFQAKSKRELLAETFQKLGRIAKPNVEPTLVVDDEDSTTRFSPPSEGGDLGAVQLVSRNLRPSGAWRYRNKVQIPFAHGPDGKLIGGFYAPGSHTVVPFEDCLVQPKVQVKIFHAVLEWFRARSVQAYDQKTGQGWARHLLIRTNSSDQALVAVISRDDYFPDAVHFSKFLQQDIPGVVSVFQNVNPNPGNVILGPQWRHLHGKRYLYESLSGLKFRLSPGSFFQVHHAMAEKLYQRVVDYLQPKPTDTVLELYAGVGAIAQVLAKRVRYVWAVEEVPSAVHDAIESIKLNDIRNVRILQGRCETVLARGRFRKSMSDRLSAVVLDPPRAGCEQHVLRAVIRQNPEKIIYVSCDPGTLARDAAYLSTGGYHLIKSTPVDLFPQTSHIESVSLFMRSK